MIRQQPEQHEMVSSEHSLDLALREPQGQAPAPKKQNVLKAVDRFLRGKYILLVVLALALGCAGGLAGYKRGNKTFASTASIRLTLRPTDILYHDPTAQLESPDVYVQDQIKGMTSWKVMVRAVQGPEWLGVRPASEESLAEVNTLTLRVQELLSKIKVTRVDGGLEVEGRDRDPAVAMAAVHSVLDAYKAVFIDKEDDQEIPPEKLKLLSLQKSLVADIERIRTKDINPIADKYGSDRLDAHYNAKFQQMTNIESAIQKLKSDIEADRRALNDQTVATQPSTLPATQVATRPAAPTTRPTMPEAHISVEELAVNDGILAGLLEAKQGAILELERAKRGTNRRALLDCEARIKSLDEQIIARANSLLAALGSGLNVPGVPPVKNHSDIIQKQITLEILEPQYKTMQDDLITIGADNLALARFRGQEQELMDKLTAVNTKLEVMQTENPDARRIKIVARGEWPAASDKDSRPKYAAAGSFAGVMFATALVMALGYLSATLKAPRDLQYDLDGRPMLGMIPQLEKGAHGTQMASLAAECVHRSRTMLEIWARGNGRMVIGVTSPSHGSGNTSVAMSLGVSFATAGLRTLLIDCDFVTNGLTPRLQTVVKRDLGRVMIRSGLLKESELETARQQVAMELNGSAKESDLGNACVKLGYLTEEEVQQAMAAQALDPVGVLDAMNGEPLESCVGKTGIKNLSILPRGNVTSAHAAKLSSHAMREVLATARQRFDTVIIDTSAILTSLEAGIVASSVDGMVMTVARGEKRGRLSEAMARLGTLQCPVAGVIFNQVRPKDMPQEPKIGRVSTMNNTALDEQTIRAANLELVGRLAMLGPLATSMVSRVPVLDERKDLE